MFLHLSVSHSVHKGGVYPSMHWGRQPTPARHIPACTGADTPHRQTYPSMHCGRHLPGQTPSLADTPSPLPAALTATAMDGMHSTGMHSFNQNVFYRCRYFENIFKVGIHSLERQTWVIQLIINTTLILPLSLKFLEDIGTFVRPLIPLFWISGDILPEFQIQGGFPRLCASLPLHN